MQMNEDARKLTKENQSAAVPGSTDVSSLTARLESIELAIKNLQEAVNQVEGGLEEKKSNREIGKSTSKQPTKDQDCIIKGPITESDLKASVAQK